MGNVEQDLRFLFINTVRSEGKYEVSVGCDFGLSMVDICLAGRFRADI